MSVYAGQQMTIFHTNTPEIFTPFPFFQEGIFVRYDPAMTTDEIYLRNSATWNTNGSIGILTHMMTSSNGNILRVTSHLCGEFTGPRLIPHTKASEAEL